MTDVEHIDDERGAGVDLERVREQQARIKLGIPLYASEQDKRDGKMRPLTEEERSLVDTYLGIAYPKTESTAEAADSEGAESRLTPESLAEAITEHRLHMQKALDDVRGRTGVGGEGLVPEPGSSEENTMLVPVMEYIQQEMERLLASGRAKDSDFEYAVVRRAYDSLLSYLDHRKAALGLSEYMKRNFAGYLSEQEKNRRDAQRAQAATEKARLWFGATK